MRLILVLFVLMPFQWAKADLCRDMFEQKSVLYSVSKNGRMSFLMGTFPVPVSSSELPQFVRDAVVRSAFYVSDFNPDQKPPDSVFESAEGRRALPYMQFMEKLEDAALTDAEKAKPSMATELRGFAKFKGRSPIYLEDVSAVVQSYFNGVNFDLLEWTFGKGDSDRLTETFKQSLRAQRDAYLAGNVEEFRRLYEQSYVDLKSEKLLQTVVKDRNEKWLPRLEELHRKGGFFFAIETGHLVGDAGLIELLDARGFTIRRVKDKMGLLQRRDESADDQSFSSRSKSRRRR